MTSPHRHWSQASQRRLQKYTDQHGRPYTAMVEIRTNEPCERVVPGFRAPLRVPQNYLKVDQENPGKIIIDYPAWIQELENADREWIRKGITIGGEQYGEKFDASVPFTQAILHKIGPRPCVLGLRTPNVPNDRVVAHLPVVAAQQGNLWVLGLEGANGRSPKMPEPLRAYFEAPADPEVVFADEFEDEFEDETPTTKSSRKRQVA